MDTIIENINFSYQDTIYANVPINSLIGLEQDNILIIWSKQRTLCHDRVDAMVEYYKHDNHHFRGNILACIIPGEPLLYLIDGQHRFACMKQLYDNGLRFNVRIDVIQVTDQHAIAEEFVNINKSVPVSIHILTFNESLDLLTNYLMISYSTQIKIHSAHRRPNINLDALKDALLKGGIDTLLASDPEILKDKFIAFITKLNTCGGTRIIKLAMGGSKNRNQMNMHTKFYNRCVTNNLLIIGIWRPAYYFTWVNLFYTWLECDII